MAPHGSATLAFCQEQFVPLTAPICDGCHMTEAPDFESLVHLHYAALYRFALSLTCNENDASDLTQQTFYIWATKGHQLRDVSKVKAWLFTTLHREFLQSQ